MSIVRRWARRLSRRRCQLLLGRCIAAPTHDVHDDPSSVAGFGRCMQQGTGFFFSEAFPPICNARTVCSSTMCLRQVESAAVECLNVADPELEGGRARLMGAMNAHLSSHIASMDLFDMKEHQSVPPVTCNLHRTDGTGALPFQENLNTEIETDLLQASMTMETTIGNTTITEVPDEHRNVALTSLICEPKEDSSWIGRREDTSYYEQHMVAGLKSDDGEDDMQEMSNLGKLSGSSKPALLAEDEKVIEDICTFLDRKAWDVDTEEYLSKNYTPVLSHLVVAMVINRQARLPVAKRFFEWACKDVGHDSFSYQALLLKLGQKAQFEEMWEVVNRMKDTGCEVSETSFCILIKAYGTACMPDMAVTAFQRISEYGVVVGTHAYTTLISVFFRLKLLGEAHLCFNKMIVDGVKLDLHLFSTLIRGFGVIGNQRDAQACFDMMLSRSLEPDLSTFSSLIEGFCCCNAMQSAMTTLGAMQKRGLKPQASTLNVIIKMLCKDGRLEEALGFFVDMQGRHSVQPSQAMYNILLRGLLVAKEFHRAMDFFKLMENEGFVDSRSYLLLSDGLRKTEETPKLLLLDHLNGLFDVHRFSNVAVCNALIYNLSHLDALDDAERIFREMVRAQAHPNISSYEIMISCYCRAQKLEEAIELLAQLRGRDWVPSVLVYTPIIKLLLIRGRVTDAYRYVQEMQGLGLEVNCLTYDHLLKLLCKQGMVENAIKICQTMMANRFTVSSDTLFELMKCLMKLQSVKAATSCFRDLYEKNMLFKCNAVLQALAVMNLYCDEE